MTKCLGCGEDVIDQPLCERCFRIKHYNQLKKVDRYDDYQTIFNNIDQKANIFLVVDILNLPHNFEPFKNFENVNLVLTKKDQLPNSIREQKIIEYIENFNLDFKNIIIISSFKNYNMDQIYQMLEKEKHNYFIGYVNSGKSTLINKIIYNYSDLKREMTTSICPATTQDFIEIKIDDKLTIIDTPGINDQNNLYNFLEVTDLPKLIVKQPINPVVYQVKENQTFVIFDSIYIFSEKNNNFIFYFSNSVPLKRVYQELDLKEQILIKQEADIVIPGLGFINVKKPGFIKYQVPKGLKIFVRSPLI